MLSTRILYVIILKCSELRVKNKNHTTLDVGYNLPILISNHIYRVYDELEM